jgi:transglutaminase-like putative cysteine protease
MLYDISMRITYDYGGFGAGGRHVARLLPAELPGEQRLVAGALDIAPRPEERTSWVDFFGNNVVEVAFREPHREIAFSVQARVNRLRDTLPLDLSPALSRLPDDLSRYRTLDGNAPHHFLAPSPRVKPSADITAYAKAFTAPDRNVFEVVEAFNNALHRDMEFDPDSTTVDTPPAEAFARRGGVCQDFTHVMIAGLRANGIPAGYVSGFLHTRPPDGGPRLEGADAMHAWVRAWCGYEAGWIEFDPTNGLVVAADHIVVARGRDYSDVSPIRGVLKTIGKHSSEHVVDVVPVRAGAAA